MLIKEPYGFNLVHGDQVNTLTITRPTLILLQNNEQKEKVITKFNTFFLPETRLSLLKQEKLISMTLGEAESVTGPIKAVLIKTEDIRHRPPFAYSLDHLENVMDTLLSPHGCPWDRAQTHESLRTYFIQEVYEAIDAIDEGNPEHLCEELGDCLYQIVFHAKLAEKEGTFTMQDVVDHISNKMKLRHPQIFENKDGKPEKIIPGNWEERKRKLKNRTHLLEGVPKCLPSLLLACIIQKKVSSTGMFSAGIWKKSKSHFEFSWNDAIDLVRTGDEQQKNVSYGKFLFELVGLFLAAGIDPELALHEWCVKFIDRFTSWENRVAAAGRKPADLTEDEVNRLWENLTH